MSLKLVALAAKLENDYADLQADNERLREALEEIHHRTHNRRVSLHMDGSEVWTSPLAEVVNGIARQALTQKAKSA